MQGKPPDKLPMAQGHAFLLPALLIIFIDKSGLLIFNSLNPMVTDLPAGRQVAILWVYLPKYSTTLLLLPKGFLANTTQFFSHKSFRML